MKILKNSILSIFAVLLLISSSCKKEEIEEPAANIPTVTTIQVHDISNTTAFSGGEVVSDGGETVLSRGVCWDTNIDPTITHSKTEDGDGAGYFSSIINGLSMNTTYYVRAYATTKNGTGYGSTMSFTTTSTSGFYFTPTNAIIGNSVTVSFFGGDEVTFTQGSNCPDLTAMATIQQGTSTIIYPSSVTYIDSKHFDATYNLSPNTYVGTYDVKVGFSPCSRTEYSSFSITN